MCLFSLLYARVLAIIEHIAFSRELENLEDRKALTCVTVFLVCYNKVKKIVHKAFCNSSVCVCIFACNYSVVKLKL